MFLGLVRRQLNGQDVVGRVASGGQRTSTSASFVNWTNVHVLVLKRVHLSRFELDDGQRVKQDLRERLSDYPGLPVPTRPFHEETPNVCPVLRLLLCVRLLFGYLKSRQENEYKYP